MNLFWMSLSIVLKDCYFEFLTRVAFVQAQPLSLEELLAKKKAEEEAEAKVRAPQGIHFLFCCSIVFPCLLFYFSFSAQVPVQSRARSRGSETEGATDRGEEEVVGRWEEEEEDVPRHRQKNDGSVSASGLFRCRHSACCCMWIITETVCYRGPAGEGETRAQRANGAREQREWRRWRKTKTQRGEG